MGGCRVKFVKVYEWFVGYDRLKIIFKSRKNKITKMSFILKMIKNWNMYKWKLNILIKILWNNVIKKFIVNNYFLNLILEQFSNFRNYLFL